MSLQASDSDRLKRWLTPVYHGTQFVRYALHVAVYRRSPARAKIDADVRRWMEVKGLDLRPDAALRYCLTYFPEFRTLFYFRLGPVGRLLAPLAPGMPTLFIFTPRDKVGPGLFIQHGFATIISAEAIGANCWVNQQVTIGYTDDVSTPVLEDGVRVGAGAMVLGAVVVGHDATVGAGAVVVKDVAANQVVAGVPARPLGTSQPVDPTDRRR